jgi:hypothetical protein
MEVYAIEFAGFYADSTSVTPLNINFYQTCFGILGERLFWTKGDAGRFSAETTHLGDKHGINTPLSGSALIRILDTSGLTPDLSERSEQAITHMRHPVHDSGRV